jgi:CBS domain containing-hemolysin-like protein
VSTLVPVLLALLLGAIGALCAAADGALASLDEAEISVDPELEALSAGRERLHRGLTLARYLAHPLAGAFAAAAAGLYELPLAVALITGFVISVAVLVLAELVPRAIGDAEGAPLARWLVPLMRPLASVCAPLALAAATIETRLKRLLSRAKRESVASEGVEERQPDRAQRTPAPPHGVFSLDDTEVQEVMVPRIDIIGIAQDTSWSEMLDRVRSAEHARLPVYRDTVDHITGILYAKDLVRAAVEPEAPPGGWLPLVRPATFVPEGKPIDQQLRDFRGSRSHMAIVVDEYGGTAGLITIEDILEEIVGEIRDEHDDEERPILSEDDRRFWVTGGVSLDDLSAALGHNFDREDVSTVGGLIFGEIGHVPRAGEELRLGGFRVVVERVVRRRVERVYFERLEQLAERSE